jgi:hypothetical protein
MEKQNSGDIKTKRNREQSDERQDVRCNLCQRYYSKNYITRHIRLGKCIENRSKKQKVDLTFSNDYDVNELVQSEKEIQNILSSFEIESTTEKMNETYYPMNELSRSVVVEDTFNISDERIYSFQQKLLSIL